MDSLVQFPFSRISTSLRPKFATLEEAADRREWALNFEVSIPAAANIFRIHLVSVGLVTGLCGLFTLRKTR